MRIRGINVQQILLGVALIAALAWNLARASEINDLRISQGATGTRVEMRMDAAGEYRVLTLANPDRLVVDFPGSRFAKDLAVPAGVGVVRAVRNGQPVPGTARVVFELGAAVAALPPRLETGADGVRLVLEWPGDADPIAAVAARVQSPQPDAGASAGASLAEVAAASEKASAEATSQLIARQQAAARPVPAPAVAASAAPAQPAAEPAAPAQATPLPDPRKRAAQAGTRPLVIAIDAGHGGQDPGAIGPGGSYEKHVVLAIARELARQINATPGMRAYLVRDRDEYVELPQRARRARQAGADMFVSIHADAAHNRAAYGSSVYTLSTRGASSQQARWLADRENASDLVGGVRLEKDTLSNVLLDLAQSGNMKASQDAARHVLDGLRGVGKTHKAQVEYANFSVLRNADMPAMLVETGFISNHDEEKRLKDPAFQRQLATALLQGIDSFFVNQPPPGTMYAARAAAATAAGSR